MNSAGIIDSFAVVEARTLLLIFIFNAALSLAVLMYVQQVIAFVTLSF